ncbi:MAG: PEP-CTERM sorting domain-containing protein [Methylibium sp.]|nr:PEP-CTERM sorting domain-containing protein [Methylibium sp.]MBA3624457.1 PEP-CTERM sorting domain-containing protein [Methylibium sp.]
MKLRSTFIALAAALVASSAQADPDLWFSDSSGRLGIIDVVTGELTTVGNMSQTMTDLAFSPSGELFGTTFGALWRIDTTNAATTFVGNHSSNVNSLVFGSDGTLYAASNTLYTLDPSNAAATTVGSIPFSSAGDLAFVGGELYLSTVFSGTNDLIRINRATGAGTVVGSIGRAEVFGLASPNGSDLFGMAGNTVFSIDVATGAAGPDLQDFSSMGFSQVFGTTFFEEALPPPMPAIPEPSTWALMGLGMAALTWAVRRQRAGATPVGRANA